MNFPAQQYALPYVPTYAPQHAMMPYTGQLPVPAGAAAPPGTEKPGITTKAWWQETTAGFPRWSLAAGAVTLGLIGYGWNSVWFDGGTRRSTSSSRRDPGRRKRRSGGKRRGRRGGRRASGGRFDFDF